MNEKKFQELIGKIGDNTHGKTLNLAFEGLTEAQITVLAKTLKENKTITVLDLSNNNMGETGAAAIAEMLSENTTLQKLNLKSTYLGDAGAGAIANALRVNLTLKQLILDHNFITSRAACVLAEVLQKVNRSLVLISLRDNQICNKAASVFYDALKQNKGIRSLDLYRNRLTYDGAELLFHGFKENPLLSDLELRNNMMIPDQFLHGMAQMMQQRSRNEYRNLISLRIVYPRGFLKGQRSAGLVEMIPAFDNLVQKIVEFVPELFPLNIDKALLFSRPRDPMIPLMTFVRMSPEDRTKAIKSVREYREKQRALAQHRLQQQRLLAIQHQFYMQNVGVQPVPRLLPPTAPVTTNAVGVVTEDNDVEVRQPAVKRQRVGK